MSAVPHSLGIGKTADRAPPSSHNYRSGLPSRSSGADTCSSLHAGLGTHLDRGTLYHLPALWSLTSGAGCELDTARVLSAGRLGCRFAVECWAKRPRAECRVGCGRSSGGAAATTTFCFVCGIAIQCGLLLLGWKEMRGVGERDVWARSSCVCILVLGRRPQGGAMKHRSSPLILRSMPVMRHKLMPQSAAGLSHSCHTFNEEELRPQWRVMGASPGE